jgi:two-component system, OmpR family, alkaline phosphatase synthesis response regulator PhoP
MADADVNLTNGKKRRILVVEDDPSISLGLSMNLEAEGYEVRVADDGETGLAAASETEFDLLILDVMLPKLNGLEVLRTVRARGETVPIIILSARGAEMDKVIGLELGAEDYITKPFGLAELLARVKAVLRRSAMLQLAELDTPSDTVNARDLEIRRASRQVFRAGEPIVLTATEFDVLWCLVQADGKVLSRDEIKAYVWGPSHHGTVRTIDNFILQLRNKLEHDPQDPEHIVTVRGVGYRFKE